MAPNLSETFKIAPNHSKLLLIASKRSKCVKIASNAPNGSLSKRSKEQHKKTEASNALRNEPRRVTIIKIKIIIKKYLSVVFTLINNLNKSQAETIYQQTVTVTATNRKLEQKTFSYCGSKSFTPFSGNPFLEYHIKNIHSNPVDKILC